MFRSRFVEAAGFAIAFMINLLIGGFVAVVFLSYWVWFVQPLGLPNIGFFHAWGLVAMSGLIVPLPQIVGEERERNAHAKRQLTAIALAWPFGFLLHLLR